MAKATAKGAAKKPAPKKRLITQDDLDNNTDLVDLGLTVGDEYEIPEQEAAKHYQEWKVEIKSSVVDGKTVKTAEKLKVVRECVKISDEEAEVLNRGILEGPNTIASMYFKAE